MVFQPGKSGNPGGITAAEQRLRRSIMGLGPGAIKRLEQLIQSENEPVALGACREVLARVHPVPKANVLAVNMGGDHLAALVGLAARVTLDHANPQPQIGEAPDIDAEPEYIPAKPLKSHTS